MKKGVHGFGDRRDGGVAPFPSGLDQAGASGRPVGARETDTEQRASCAGLRCAPAL
jgi:hypothetical protein